MRKLKILSVLLVAVPATVGLGLVWRTLSLRERAALTPPSGIDTLVEFAEFMPPPHRLDVVDYEGQAHYVWEGDWLTWDFPSGPSCYVFNSRGELIDWSPATGDGQSPSHFANLATRGNSLSLDESLSRIYAIGVRRR